MELRSRGVSLPRLGAGTAIPTQGPARGAFGGVAMDWWGRGDADESASPMLIWGRNGGRSVDGEGFHTMGVPLNHPFRLDFPFKPSSYWGTLILRNPHILWYFRSGWVPLPGWFGFIGKSCSWQNQITAIFPKNMAICSKHSQKTIELAGSVPKVVQLDRWRQRLDDMKLVPLRLRRPCPGDSRLIQTRSPHICNPSFIFEAVCSFPDGPTKF